MWQQNFLPLPWPAVIGEPSIDLCGFTAGKNLLPVQWRSRSSPFNERGKGFIRQDSVKSRKWHVKTVLTITLARLSGFVGTEVSQSSSSSACIVASDDKLASRSRSCGGLLTGTPKSASRSRDPSALPPFISYLYIQYECNAFPRRRYFFCSTERVNNIFAHY